MSAHSVNYLYLPGEEEVELWRQASSQSWERVAGPGLDRGKGGLWALDCSAVDSAPTWVPGAIESDLEDAILLHWAALGLDTDQPGQSWTHWTLAHEEGRVLVGTVALVEDNHGHGHGQAALWGRLMPSTFDLSARFYPLPQNGVALWRELGRYVVAFTRGAQLLHLSALSAPRLDAAAALEVRDLALSLELRECLSVQNCRVWTLLEEGSSFPQLLGEQLGVSVQVEPRPAPTMPAVGLPLLPPLLALVREERRRRRRVARWVLAAGVVYGLIFALWAGWLWWRQQQLDQGWADLRRTEPRTQMIRETEARWAELQPALDPNRYPAEVFHRMVELLPPEGIRLKEFTLDQDKLVVAGEASSVNHALKFKADLQGSEPLQRYEWNFPQPTVLSDNRASFRTEGSVKR